MKIGLLGVRRSILISLGLAMACGPEVGTGDSGGQDDGSASDPSASATDASASADDGQPTESGTADDGEPPATLCEGSTPILQAGVEGSMPAGFEVCDNGVIHRPATTVCAQPASTAPSCELEEQSCTADAECTDGAFGRCIQYTDPFLGEDFCGCRYGCETDSDCDAGEVCACGAADIPGYPSQSQCIPAGCTDDAACGETMCALGAADDGCSRWYEAECLDETSECMVDDECESLGNCFPDTESGQWTCQDFCCCGRPLLVDGCPVTAAVVEDEQWATSAEVASLAALPTVVRQRIAAHYQQAAALEHASVASFSRFALELLQHGAPPQLLELAHRAGLDEIDHARRCFALASAYEGRSLGAGPLCLSGVELGSSFEAMLRAVIDEACVGETLAAVEAGRARGFARSEAVQQTLAVIEADELRHAQLGWRTLSWGLRRADVPTRDRLLAYLDAAIGQAMQQRPVKMVDHDRALLRAHGVLDPADRRRAHGDAVTEVLRPCATALRQSFAANARDTEPASAPA